jgi:hypothetical protein
VITDLWTLPPAKRSSAGLGRQTPTAKVGDAAHHHNLSGQRVVAGDGCVTLPRLESDSRPALGHRSWLAAAQPARRGHLASAWSEPAPTWDEPGRESAAAAPDKPRRRRRPGCCGCMALALLALVVLVGAAVAVGLLYKPPSRNFTLGPRENAGSGSVSASGGTFTLQNPSSRIDGLSIEAIEGAFPKGATFQVSTQPIEEHRFGALFDPRTPLIHIDNGGQFAADPLRVVIPVQLAEGDFAMAFFYDRQSGKLEGLPLAELERDHVTVITSHFSDMVVSRVKQNALGQVEVDTGFSPGVDDWPFVNVGSAIEPPGICSGMALSAMWYYTEKRLAGGEPPLFGRFDNNGLLPATPKLGQDDSWGYRFGTVVQLNHTWTSGSRRFFDWMGGLDDRYTWYAFAYNMALYGEPQYVSIGSYQTDANGTRRRSGHAIVAYKIVGDRLYVADPNYPGDKSRFIAFENGVFQPYESSGYVFTEIRYLAQSALVDYGDIAVAYGQMLKGEAGKGVFSAWELKYATGVNELTGDFEWSAVPDKLEVDEATTAIDKDRVGKLLFRLAMQQGFEACLYRGAAQVLCYASTPDQEVYFEVPLDKGANDLGFYVGQRISNQQKHVDFRRVQVQYGDMDYSGTWKGRLTVVKTDKLRALLEQVVAGIIHAFRPELSQEEALAAARSSIKESPREDTELVLVLEKDPEGKPDRYPGQITLTQGEGEAQVFDTTATVRNSTLQFSFAENTLGATMRFEGHAGGKNLLVGSYGLDWFVLRDLVEGTWEVSQEEVFTMP